jgi:hypothetical protein
MVPRLALTLVLAALAGCIARPTPACLERCALDLQVRDPAQCQTLCTTKCSRLADTYGMDVDKCRALQADAVDTPAK